MQNPLDRDIVRKTMAGEASIPHVPIGGLADPRQNRGENLVRKQSPQSLAVSAAFEAFA